VAVFFFWLVSEHQVLGTNIKSKALSGDVVEIANGETLCHPTFPHTIHIERDDWIVRRVTLAIRTVPLKTASAYRTAKRSSNRTPSPKADCGSSAPHSNGASNEGPHFMSEE